MRTKDDFRGYQEVMIPLVKEIPNIALWAEMGLGKSIITLTAVDELLDELRCHRVLVVSTIRNVEATWPDEPLEWEHTQHIDVVPIRGTPEERLALIAQNDTFQAINLELLQWLVSQYRVRKNRRTGVVSCDWPWDTVILDESGLVRNHDTNRFRALRKMRPFITRMIQMTGTPLPKGLHNLWSQLYLLDGGERLGRTVGAFRARWFTRDPYKMKWEARPGAKEEIIELTKDICFSLREKDYLNLPEMAFNPIRCRLPTAAMEQYLEMEEEHILEVGEHEITAVTAGVLFGKLLQLANGAFYTDDEGSWEEFHTAKLDALADIIDETNGQPLLIAYNFKSDRARLAKRFPEIKFVKDYKDSRKMVKDWNADKISLLGSHPQSIGHGLNMQKGNAAGIVWFGLTPNLDDYLQLNKRLHRSGQRNKLFNHHIIADDTVDERIISILAEGELEQDEVMDAFRVYVEERRKK